MVAYKTIVALSQRTLTISSGTSVFEYGGTPHSTASDLTYTAAEWMEYINTTASFSGAYYQDEYEFCYFSSISNLKITNSDLADLIGFPFNVTRSAEVVPGFGSIIYGTSWGNARLVLQGSEHTQAGNNRISYVKMMPIEGVPFTQDVKHLVGFGPLDDYTKDIDKIGYNCEVAHLDESKIQWVKNFLHEGKTDGERDLCNVYGEFRINGGAVYIDMNRYRAAKTDRSQGRTVSFNIGFVEQVMPANALLWNDGSPVYWNDGTVVIDG